MSRNTIKTICFVIPAFPVASETFVTNQIIEVKKRGYKVLVLTHHLGKIEQSSQKTLLEQYGILDDVTVIEITVPKSKLKRFFSGLLLIFTYFKYWIRIPNLSLRYRIINSPFLLRFYSKFRHVDVFHVQFAAAGRGVAEMKACGLLQGKLITTFHGHDAHFTNAKQLKKLQEHYRFIFDVSDFVTVNTPYLGANVIQLGCAPEKLRVVYMGIDVSFFNNNQLRKGFVANPLKLISVGRLVTFKGFKYAISAIKLLVDQGVHVQYTIIGEGSLFSKLSNQITDLKLENNVALVGRKSQEAIKAVLAESDLYLMSSITNKKGRCETQGVVTAEAQAMGLPIVAFNSGGVPYTIINGKTGLLVPEKDVAGYAAAIIDLIVDAKRYEQMSQAAVEFARSEFSNDLMMERFMALYDA